MKKVLIITSLLIGILTQVNSRVVESPSHLVRADSSEKLEAALRVLRGANDTLARALKKAESIKI
jgi:hypothetical protein